jgi:predicted ATP-binding protein involved in virulence
VQARIRSIEVEGLFGGFDHRFELDVDERVTVVYGANGVGKTTILKLVEALLSGRWRYVADIRFWRLAVTRDESTQVSVCPAEGPICRPARITQRVVLNRREVGSGGAQTPIGGAC